MTTSTRMEPAVFAPETDPRIFDWLRRRKEPEWLRDWRRRCYERMAESAWPESRYTRLRGFHPEDLRRATPPRTRRTAGRGGIRRYAVWVEAENGGIRSLRVPTRGSVEADILTFREMLTSGDPRLQEYYRQELFRIPFGEGRAAVLLHAAWNDGLWIDIHGGTEALMPEIVIRHTQTGSRVGYAWPIVIRVGPNQRAAIILEHLSKNSEGPALGIHGLDLRLEAQAEVQITTLYGDAEHAHEFTYHAAELDRDAHLQWNTGWFGGRLAMGRKTVRLTGRGAELFDTQVLFGHRRQHFDLQSFTHHLKPDTISRVNVRGALKNRARSIFYGLVRIEHGAKRSDARLQDHVLLLNPGAHSDSIPALEIEENEVRCSHSASVGRIDEEKIFYAMSRGLPETEARRLIVEGFLHPAVQNIPVDEIRERVLQLIRSKWP